MLSGVISVQCGECGHANDDRARFCAGCGAPLAPLSCPACSGALPEHARFCPSCGAPAQRPARVSTRQQATAPSSAPAVGRDPVWPAAAAPAQTTLPPADPTADPPPVFFAVPPETPRSGNAGMSSSMPASGARPMDRADALLASRDPEGIPYPEETSPEDLELYHRVIEDRERRRRRRRTLAAAVGAFAVLIAGLVVARRASEHTANEGSAPPAATAEAPPSEASSSTEGRSPEALSSEARSSTPSDAGVGSPPPGDGRTAAATDDSRSRQSEAARESTPTDGRASATPRREATREKATRSVTSGPRRDAAADTGRRTATPEPTPNAAGGSLGGPRRESTSARALELPERETSPRVAARPQAPDSAPPTRTPRPTQPPAAPAAPVVAAPSGAVTPAAPAAARSPDVRVEVAQKVDRTNSAIDYTVRVSGPDGGPVVDADVRLRGVTTDGVLVEAPLEPAGTPGVYSGLIAFSTRGPRGLTVRVARADRVVEVPVSAPALRAQ
jgi:hypothetical protein